MRKLLTVLIALAGLAFASAPASSGCISLLGVGKSCGATGGGGGAAAPVVTADAKSVFGPNGNSQPINVGAGDLVVVVLSGYSLTASQTASSPNLGTFTSHAFSSLGGQILYAYNTGGALTGEVITLGTSLPSWHVYSISGAAASSPIDGYTFIPTTGSSQPLAVSLATTYAGDLLIGQTSGSFSADTSWTPAPAGGTAYGDSNEYRRVSATGTFTAWVGQSGDASSLIFAVKGP